MEKSPISALMEYLVSKGLSAPVYENLAKTGPQHKPTFRIRVTADGFVSEGEGSTKQEAKSKACKTLLDMLKIGTDFKKVKISSSSSNIPKANGIAKEPEVIGNFIGDLIQLCQKYHLPEPDYALVKTDGPDHMKEFTVECSVFRMKESAKANTLKDAKKIAASKIMRRLENEIKNNKTVQKLPQVKDLTSSAQEAIKTYESIKERYTKVEETSFKDYHKVYEDMPDKSATLLKVINNRLPDSDPLTLMKKIASELQVKLTVRDMNRSVLKQQFNLSIFLMQLGTIPPLSSLGLDEPEAATKLLDTLVVMCT